MTGRERPDQGTTGREDPGSEAGGPPGTIAGVVLAAGISSRMGRPKQTLPLGGETILQRVLHAAEAAGLDEVLVVLGHRASEVRASAPLPPAARVVTVSGRAAQSASLRAGLRATSPSARAAVILLGDQPTVDPSAIRAVVDAYRRTGAPVVQARYGGRWGHPVLLDREVWGDVERVGGDVGARDVIEARAEEVVAADLPGDPPPDIDTPEDYERAREALGLTPPARRTRPS